MGVILCKKHGRQGFYETCEHIDAEFKKGVYKQYRRLGFYSTLLCDECWRMGNADDLEKYSETDFEDFLNLPDDKAEKLKKSFRELYDKLNRKCWCCECIAEVKIKTWRREKKPDPFPTFENTLTEAQKEKVDELEKNLTENFQFQNSLFWKTQFQDRPAISVRAGAFTYPLTVIIYYVASEDEQNRIIEFIEKFLLQTKFNQSRIIFHEAENWTSRKNQFGGLNWHRGEEKILREVHLNY